MTATNRMRPSRAPKGPARATDAYHHGDLRRALLEAGAEELSEKGVEGFTLRGCARRAGVSHAAPAHHFRDARALLTALATIGFERFAATMRARMDEAGDDPGARFVGCGVGYVDFALENPGLFRLMFASGAHDRKDAALKKASDASFGVLLDALKATGRDVRADPARMTDAVAAWSLVHGMADLLLNGRLPAIASLPHAEKKKAIMAAIESLRPAEGRP